MSNDVQRELRRLRANLRLAVAFCGVLTLTAFASGVRPTRFEEIDVQRINVREPDGTLRMVLSNRPKSPGGGWHGKELLGAGARPGIVFYNDEGTESGGLVYEGKAQTAGGRVAGAQLSFDQYDQDQLVTLVYEDEKGRRMAGLNVTDRPDVPMIPWMTALDSVSRMPDGAAKDSARARLMAQTGGIPATAPRVFVGRDRAGASVIRLSDAKGHLRLRFVVDSAGSARIEFLDERGRVTQQIPPS